MKPALIILSLLLIFQPLIINPVKASLSSCTASVSPTNVYIGASADLTFTVTNADSASAVWIKVLQAPSYRIDNIASSGFSGTTDGTTATLTGGTLSGGSSASITVSVSAAGEARPSEDWTVQISDDNGGASPTTCTGSLSTTISGNPPPAPSISDLSVSDVSTSSVTITWTTDVEASTEVDYGTTDSYGSTAGSNSDRSTTHSVTLSSLSANSTYHYKVRSTSSDGTSETGDNTFVTSKTDSTTTTTTTTNTTTTTVVTSSPKPILDNASPQVTFDTDFSKPFTEVPKITGKIIDDKEVVSADYSIDNGKNWLPVDKLTPIAKNISKKTFEFTPAIFEDGNYQIKVRGEDSSGNEGLSAVKTLIYDRLPPQMVGTLFSVGPQIILPNEKGIITTLQGLDTKITLSAVGGPTSIDLITGNQTYSLVKNVDSGLWSGTISFQDSGTHDLTAKLTDGAGNTTNREVGKIDVQAGGSVSEKGGKKIAGANITLYYFEPSAQRFIIWDGQPFSESNPQKTSSDGNFHLFVPPGKYFIRIDSPGFKPLQTNIFTLNKNTFLTSPFILKKPSLAFPFLNLSNWEDEVTINLSSIESDLASENSVLNQEMPFFNFKELNANNIKGKPTVLTFMTTWSPQAVEQLAFLEKLTNPELNRAVIFEGETTSIVNIYKKRGGYQAPILADPDATLAPKLGILALPTHVFLDRKGIIRKIKVGVLNKQELLDNLIN